MRIYVRRVCLLRVKDRHALHALIESLDGTTSRIVSIARCSIAEYNELRKGFMHPDFIEE